MLQNKYFRTKVHNGQWNFRHYSFPFDVQHYSFPKRLTWKVKAMTLPPLSPPSEHYVTYWSFFIKSLRKTETSCAHQPESGEKHTHMHLLKSTDPQEMIVTSTHRRSRDKCGVLWSQWAISAVFPLTSQTGTAIMVWFEQKPQVGSVFQSLAGFVWK